ncbi:DUF982 domain-containing protein [Ensifer adhaerens]|uniref:DUF982 domain-containing protein n=1 Tax=Ensifer adhaerens TaxID=106592 RepID=UPI001AEDB91B|nr:DUF982 domain-containing protein [Ensifer adhaerens]
MSCQPGNRSWNRRADIHLSSANPKEDATITIWEANIEVTINDRFDVIRSARKAVACLMKLWSNTKCASDATARKACLDAANGTAPNAEVRAAIEAAAKDAGILRKC